jgi:uncharacterized protein (TIGR02466 family)
MVELKLFHSPLRYKVLDNVNNNAIIEYCYNYQKNNPSREISNVGGYQSNDLKDYIPELNEVFKNVLQWSNKEFSKFGKTDEYTTVISNSWININQKNTYNSLHDHPRCYYSFVYYVKVPLNSGNINFHHPSPTIEHTWSDSHFVGERDDMEDSVCYRVWKEPVNGLLVMFPAWLKHSVDMNKSNEDRISIAINTHIENINYEKN